MDADLHRISGKCSSSRSYRPEEQYLIDSNPSSLPSSWNIQVNSYSPGNGGQDAINGANWYVSSVLWFTFLS